MKLKSFSDLQQIIPRSDKSDTQESRGKQDIQENRLRIYLETKGRNGKVVTIIAGLRHDPGTIKEIARMLKEKCGTGGTVKNGNIELQGDRRARSSEELLKLNYKIS